MSVDFAALAQAVLGGLAEVRACLIVSRDGLVLGAQPPNKESRALDIWGRVTGLGDVERGFAVVGDELWSFCRRGPYGALAIADPTARPGVILDRLERTLLIAEDDRVRSDALRQVAETESAQPRRLRTPLHREAKPEVDAPEVISQREQVRASAWAERFKDVAQSRAVHASDQGTPPSSEYTEEVPEEVAGSDAHSDEDAWSVDTAALRREFHGLVE